MTNPETFHARVAQITANFVTGQADRETSLQLFEQVLHEFGFLPKEETIDRSISNENFLSLLRMAREQKNPASNPVQRLTDQWRAVVPRLAAQITNRCPVCQQQAPQGLYSSMQDMDGKVVPVDPPRCHACMIKWVEKYVEGPSIRKELPSFSVDESTVKPLDTAETDFFKQMEKDMEGFKL
jgi:Pyruvate/2-oxoacid:ferredoxin oxidoreductase delta subunit